MKRLIGISLVFLVIAAFVCGCADTAADEQRTDLDSAIHALSGEIGRYYTLGSEASADTIRSETDRVSSAWDLVEQSAQGLDDIDTTGVAETFDALSDAVDGLSDDVGSDALASIMPYIQALQTAVEELHQSGGFHD